MKKDFKPLFSYTDAEELQRIEFLKRDSLIAAQEIKEAYFKFDPEVEFSDKILQSIYRDRGEGIILSKSQKIDNYINAQLIELRGYISEQVLPSFNQKTYDFKNRINEILNSGGKDWKFCKYLDFEQKFIIDEDKIKPLIDASNKYLTNEVDVDFYNALQDISKVFKKHSELFDKFQEYEPLSKVMLWINKENYEVDKFAGVKSLYDAYVKYKNRK